MKQMIPRAEKILSRYDQFKLPALIEVLEAALANIPEDQRAEATFEIDVESPPYDGGEYPGLFLMYQGLETDAEEKKREGLEADWKTRQEERDLAEFVRLSKKFAK